MGLSSHLKELRMELVFFSVKGIGGDGNDNNGVVLGKLDN